MSSVWTTKEARLFLNALMHFNRRERVCETNPEYIISPTTGCLLVFAGTTVAKCPPKHLPDIQRDEYVRVEYDFGMRLPLESRVVEDMARVVLAPQKWTLGRGQLGISVLIMKRLNPDECFIVRAEQKRLPPEFGQSLGKTLRACHESSSYVSAHEALSTWQFEQNDLQSYLDRLKGCPVAFVTNEEIQRLHVALTRSSVAAFNILKERAAFGFFCETHGDLHMDNLWFINSNITFIDPMPKRIRRRVDPLVDVARLSLELLRLELPQECRAFLKTYGAVGNSDMQLMYFFATRHVLADIVSLSQYPSGIAPPRARHIGNPFNALDMLAAVQRGLLNESQSLTMKDN